MKVQENVQMAENAVENKPAARKGLKARLSAMLAVLMAFAMAVPAFAEETGGGGGTVTGGVATLVDLVGQVVSLITGNTILLVMVAGGLLGVAIGVFARLFRSVRH